MHNMKKGAKLLIFFLIGIALLGSVIGFGCWYELKNGVEVSEKAELHRWLTIKAQLEKMEDALEVWWRDEQASDKAEAATEISTAPVVATEGETYEETVQLSEAIPGTTETFVETENVTEEAAQGGYVVQIYQGGIGIFDTEGTLIEQVNLAVVTLPLADREALASGIRVNTMEEAHRIIEKLV